MTTFLPGYPALAAVMRTAKVVHRYTDLLGVEARILAERGRISPLYQVLLNSPPIADGWERLLTAVRNRTAIPADLRELMILRVAVLNRASFEFDAHVPHAQRAGVGDDKIAALRQAGIAIFRQSVRIGLGPLLCAADKVLGPIEQL